MRTLSVSLLAVSWLAAGLAAAPLPLHAQGFFIPGQPKSAAAPSRTTRQTTPRRVIPAPAPAPAVEARPADQPSDAQSQAQAQQALPPPPELPALPKGPTPPAAVIGVLGVPEVMHASTAAVQVEKTISDRRKKLDDDARNEQAAWRDMQQSLVNDRGKLTPDQVRARERQLQERITNSQRLFRQRGQVIQEAAQYALNQIERTLISVIRQVADSRGMNLVLHRQQVALNVNEFDITQQVTEQMNKVMASVVIPPDGVAPPTVPSPQPASVTLPPSKQTGSIPPAAAPSQPTPAVPKP